MTGSTLRSPSLRWSKADLLIQLRGLSSGRATHQLSSALSGGRPRGRSYYLGVSSGGGWSRASGSCGSRTTIRERGSC